MKMLSCAVFSISLVSHFLFYRVGIWCLMGRSTYLLSFLFLSIPIFHKKFTIFKIYAAHDYRQTRLFLSLRESAPAISIFAIQCRARRFIFHRPISGLGRIRKNLPLTRLMTTIHRRRFILEMLTSFVVNLKRSSVI